MRSITYGTGRGARSVMKLVGKGYIRPKTMNKLEAAYALCLEAKFRTGEILWYAYEPMKFKLGDGAWFTPDFGVMLKDMTIEFRETKGFMREAANVRLKVAASKYPFKFVLVKFSRSTGWVHEEM